MVLVEERQQGPQRALLEHVVTALWTVSCDVAESPDCLLTDVKNGRRQEFDEDGHRAGVDDDLGVLGGSGCDVCESPRCFKLLYGEH